MDEARLVEKLRKIEALFAGATTGGEREAAGEARARIQESLRELEDADPPIEYRFSIPDPWSRRVFLALLRRYDLHPYRHRGQPYASVMVRAPRRFVEETLRPQFSEIWKTLHAHLDEVTTRVVAEVLQADSAEADEESPPPRLAPSNAPEAGGTPHDTNPQ